MPVMLSLLTAGHCAKPIIIFFQSNKKKLEKKKKKNHKNLKNLKKYQKDVGKQSDVCFFSPFSPAEKCSKFSAKCEQ